MLSHALLVSAVTASEAAPASTSGAGLLGSLLGLVLGIVQLVIALGIAAFAINQGFGIVGRMLEGINIWAEVKKRNTAVAALAAGVVIAYTNVIGSGIKSMTEGLGSLANLDWGPGVSAIVGGVVSLIVAIMVASFAITVTFRVMDRLTTDIKEKDEFQSGNLAIGIVYAGIMIGVSGLIGAGVSGIGVRVADVINSVLGHA